MLGCRAENPCPNSHKVYLVGQNWQDVVSHPSLPYMINKNICYQICHGVFLGATLVQLCCTFQILTPRSTVRYGNCDYYVNHYWTETQLYSSSAELSIISQFFALYYLLYVVSCPFKGVGFFPACRQVCGVKSRQRMIK